MSTFLREMAKRAYSTGVHRRLMSSTVREAFPEGVNENVRDVLVRGAVQADAGLRHPWLPWNDVQHAFPSVTKKEFAREVRFMRDDALKNLSRAITDEELGKLRRNTLMMQGLLGVGHAQHAQMDLGSHYNKPLEHAAKSEDPSALKDMKKFRSALRVLPGYYGGMITAGVEHAKSGVLLRHADEGAKANLDRLQPSKYKSDTATLDNAKQFGGALRSALVEQVRRDTGVDAPKAEEMILKRLKEFKPNIIERVAGSALDTGQYAVQQAQRFKRLPETMSERGRYVYDAAKTVLRGVIGG